MHRKARRQNWAHCCLQGELEGGSLRFHLVEAFGWWGHMRQGCGVRLLGTDSVSSFSDLLSIHAYLVFLLVTELCWFIRLCASRAPGDCMYEQVWTGKVRITVSDDTQLTCDKHSRWNWNSGFIFYGLESLTIYEMFLNLVGLTCSFLLLPTCPPSLPIQAGVVSADMSTKVDKSLRRALGSRAVGQGSLRQPWGTSWDSPCRTPARGAKLCKRSTNIVQKNSFYFLCGQWSHDDAPVPKKPLYPLTFGCLCQCKVILTRHSYSDPPEGNIGRPVPGVAVTPCLRTGPRTAGTLPSFGVRSCPTTTNLHISWGEEMMQKLLRG